jgi:hypothetical protein
MSLDSQQPGNVVKQLWIQKSVRRLGKINVVLQKPPLADFVIVLLESHCCIVATFESNPFEGFGVPSPNAGGRVFLWNRK